MASKIRNHSFSDGPPFISEADPKYLWFEEIEYFENKNNAGNNAVLSVDWCSDSVSVFASSSANGHISIWDRRSSERTKPALWTLGTPHNQSILSVAWNPIQHSLIASGDGTAAVRIWDIRSLNRHVVQLSQHRDKVYHVKWCPDNKYLLASSGNDRMLFLYDLRRTGSGKESRNGHPESNGNDGQHNGRNMQMDGIETMEQLLEKLSANTVGNVENVKCPEMVFAHCGHTACVPEFDWCPSGDLTMVSSDMDGMVHCWQPPTGMLNTFGWVLHSQKRDYVARSTECTNIKDSMMMK